MRAPIERASYTALAPTAPALKCSRQRTLFGRLAVEVFLIRIRFGACTVHNAVPMIRWRVDRVQLHRNTASIDDIVICPCWDNDRKTGADLRPNAIEYRSASPFLDTKELVELVNFRPDLLLRQERHEDQLAVLCRVNHLSKFLVLYGETLDVFDKTFHGESPMVSATEQGFSTRWQAKAGTALLSRTRYGFPNSLNRVRWERDARED
jgi:hypothetical protein